MATGSTAIGAVVRYPDGSPSSDTLSVGTSGSIFIDDGTGFVSAATPAAERVDATPVRVGRLNHVTADADEGSATTTGALTIQRGGDYRIRASGDCLSGNAAVVVIEVFKTPIATGVAAVISSSAAHPGGSVRADLKMAGTAVKMSWSMNGDAVDLVPGDILDVRVTSDVGTVTIKRMCFEIELKNSVNPPSPV